MDDRRPPSPATGAPAGEAPLVIDPHVLEAIPAAVYLCGADGVIVQFNRRAAELWGRSPGIGYTDERFCGAFLLYDLEGNSLPPDRTPMAVALRTGEPQAAKEVVIERPDGSRIIASAHINVLKDRNGRIRGAINCFQDITERQKAEHQRSLLVAELNHRVKNTLATVISIAQQSFARNPNAGEALDSFSSRLRALAQTHIRLAESSWSGASLKEMLLDEFSPYLRDDARRLRVSGPSVTVNAKYALTLGMGFHELVTNAARHGALSAPGGVVEVVWDIDPQDEQLRIRWSETGGPKVSPPARRGFGRLLLERALSSDLGGSVHFDFAESGLGCAIALPLQGNIAHTTSDALPETGRCGF